MATMNINWKPGQSIIYAGTPIDEDGNIANNSNAVALVVSDTLNPNAAEVITEGTWDEETNYHGITISDECKRALNGIVFVGSDGENLPIRTTPIEGCLSLVSGGGINITWDGSTEGRDTFDLIGMSLYKVAGGFLSVDELTGCELTLNDSTTYTLDEELISIVVPNKLISCGDSIVSCIAGTYELPVSASEVATIIIPSDGVYFMEVETHGQVLRPTSLTKSAPSKLMQNGIDVTEAIASLILGYAD